MSERRWSLTVLPGILAVARLEPTAAVPGWAEPGKGTRSGAIGGGEGEGGDPAALYSWTRTASELSVVCEAARVPAGVTAERDWRALRVAGPLDFSEIGVLASLTAVLAAAEVSVFALSTFDTDYLLVRESTLAAAVAALRKAGHTVLE